MEKSLNIFALVFLLMAPVQVKANTALHSNFLLKEGSPYTSDLKKRIAFNKQRLEEMQGKLQELGKILAKKESRLAIVSNQKFDIELKLTEIEGQIKNLQSEVNSRQRKMNKLIKKQVTLGFEKENSIADLLIRKAIKDEASLVDKELLGFEEKIFDLKSKIMVLTENLDNFGDTEETIVGQLKNLKEIREETISEVSELEGKIDELIRVKIDFKVNPVKVAQRPSAQEVVVHDHNDEIDQILLPVENYFQVIPSKKGVTIKLKESTSVIAPSSGRVAYLGQLSNLGDVIILDHGNEYRSIILGKVSYQAHLGDEIKKGEVLGYAQKIDEVVSQVYFEVRHKNIPQRLSSFLDKKINVSLNNISKK